MGTTLERILCPRLGQDWDVAECNAIVMVSMAVALYLPYLYPVPLFSGRRAVCARLPGDDVLARHDTTQLRDREEETGYPRRICLPHR